MFKKCVTCKGENGWKNYLFQQINKREICLQELQNTSERSNRTEKGVILRQGAYYGAMPLRCGLFLYIVPIFSSTSFLLVLFTKNITFSPTKAVNDIRIPITRTTKAPLRFPSLNGFIVCFLCSVRHCRASGLNLLIHVFKSPASRIRIILMKYRKSALLTKTIEILNFD